MKGLVVVGYQGIGKSSLGGLDNCIDLESGNFFVGSKRADDWYIPYCQIALNLANQRYTVFVSSHKEVYEYLKGFILPEHVGKIVVCCPSSTLRDEWIDKLQERWDRTNLSKDYKALKNAEDRFTENIQELCSCGLPVYQLESMEYSLKPLVNRIRFDWCREG